MSMIGNYAMVDPDIIEKVQEGILGIREVLYDEGGSGDEGGFLCIDKAWHAIHFTLTGTAFLGDSNDPLSKVVLHENLLVDEDVGYGPPMYLSAEEVEETSAALQAVSDDEFKAKFDLAAIRENEIYPGMDDEYAEEYVMAFFVDVKDFFARAAEARKCVIFFVN